jgi:hypothetical protein
MRGRYGFKLLGFALAIASLPALVACRSTTNVTNQDPGTAQPATPTVEPADPNPDPGVWKEFASTTFAVDFRYPEKWQQQPDSTRYEGADGFFSIAAALSSYTLEETCVSEADHTLKHYGSNPLIEYLTVVGQRGCLILPSADAPLASGTEQQLATFLIAYPTSIWANCESGPGENYFLLNADKDHIRQIAATITFLPPSSNAGCLPLPTPVR